MLCEMQSVSSRIWTHVTVSISCEDNHYTTGTSMSRVILCLDVKESCSLYIHIYIFPHGCIRCIWPKDKTLLQVSMDLGVMGTKWYNTLLKSPELEPRHHMQFSVIHRTPHFLEGKSYSSAEDAVNIFWVPLTRWTSGSESIPKLCFWYLIY